MPKWEYEFVTAVWSGNSLQVVVSQSGSSTTSRHLKDVMNDLGQQGWELVDITYDPPGGMKQAFLTFKREVS